MVATLLFDLTLIAEKNMMSESSLFAKKYQELDRHNEKTAIRRYRRKISKQISRLLTRSLSYSEFPPYFEN